MGQALSVEWTTVLDLKRLQVEARPRPSLFDRWFTTRISVVARPFGGVLETIFTKEGLTEFADALDLLDPVGEVTLGGDRASELVLTVERQVNGVDGALAVESCLTPNGDDPYPLLRWLLFDVKPFAGRTAGQVRRLVSTEPWPTP